MTLQVQVRRLYLRKLLFLVAALTLLVVVAWYACVTGVAQITLPRLVATLFPGAVDAPVLNKAEWVSFTGIRLPRVATGVLAGALLAICGSLMQTITGNDMASPFTTGISSAAAFGAGLGLLAGGPGGSAGWTVIAGAFVAAVACSVLVFGIAGIKAMGQVSIILTGIALSYFFSAAHAALEFVASEQHLAAIVGWTFGDLSRATWPQIGLLGALLVVASAYVLLRGRDLTLLALGEEGAKALGVDVRRVRLGSGLLVTFAAATVVSLCGIIGFVGLVAPHIASLLIGTDRRLQIPMAAILGAALLAGADVVGRTIFSPVVIPVGIVVSFLGVPVFVSLIIRNGRAG